MCLNKRINDAPIQLQLVKLGLYKHLYLLVHLQSEMMISIMQSAQIPCDIEEARQPRQLPNFQSPQHLSSHPHNKELLDYFSDLHEGYAWGFRRVMTCRLGSKVQKRGLCTVWQRSCPGQQCAIHRRPWAVVDLNRAHIVQTIILHG